MQSNFSKKGAVELFCESYQTKLRRRATFLRRELLPLKYSWHHSSYSAGLKRDVGNTVHNLYKQNFLSYFLSIWQSDKGLPAVVAWNVCHKATTVSKSFWVVYDIIQLHILTGWNIFNSTDNYYSVEPIPPSVLFSKSPPYVVHLD